MQYEYDMYTVWIEILHYAEWLQLEESYCLDLKKSG